MWRLHLVGLVGTFLLVGCASLPPARPPSGRQGGPSVSVSRWTPALAEQTKAGRAEEPGKPLGATWRLKPVGTLDAMRSPEEEAAQGPPGTMRASSPDPGLRYAVAFGADAWVDPLNPSVVLLYPATLLLLELPLRLHLGIKWSPHWR